MNREISVTKIMLRVCFCNKAVVAEKNKRAPPTEQRRRLEGRPERSSGMPLERRSWQWGDCDACKAMACGGRAAEAGPSHTSGAADKYWRLFHGKLEVVGVPQEGGRLDGRSGGARAVISLNDLDPATKPLLRWDRLQQQASCKNFVVVAMRHVACREGGGRQPAICRLIYNAFLERTEKTRSIRSTYIPSTPGSTPPRRSVGWRQRNPRAGAAQPRNSRQKAPPWKGASTLWWTALSKTVLHHRPPLVHRVGKS